MPSPRRVLLALAIGAALGFVILVAQLVARNYPSSDGISLADGQLLGGDFVAFYVGGRLFELDRPRLYDLEYQREFRIELLGPAAGLPEAELPFVYPPLVAAALSPLSRLPFQQAFVLWTILGLLVSVSSLALLMRASGATGVLPLPLLLLFSFGFVPYSLNTFLGGQSSWLGMAILATVSVAVLRKRDGLAGVIMSFSYYRPPPFFFLLIVLSLARGRRFVLGFVAGAAALVVGTIVLVGADGVGGFLHAASIYLRGGEAYDGMVVPQGEGVGVLALASLLTSSVPTSLLLLGLPFAFLVRLCYRLIRVEEDSTRLAGLVLGTTESLALSVYLLKYDLALLLIPMVLGIAWSRGAHGLGRRLSLLPLIGFYLEFPFRQLSLGGSVVNAASFLFLVLLGALTCQVWSLSKGSVAGGLSGAPNRDSEGVKRTGGEPGVG